MPVVPVALVVLSIAVHDDDGGVGVAGVVEVVIAVVVVVVVAAAETTAGAALVSAAAWAAQPTAADSAAPATVFQTAAEQNDCYASNLRAIGCCTQKNCLQELQTVRLLGRADALCLWVLL